MNAQALALVLAGASLHAVWNLVAKRASGGLAFVWLYGWVSLAIFLPLALWSARAADLTLNLAAWIAILASGVLHVVYALVLQRGYRVADLSVVYPMARGTGPLFAVLGAVLLLGNRPAASGWLGIAAILAGIFLMAGGGLLRRVEQGADPALARGLGWGAATGLFIAAYTLVDGWAIQVLGLAPLLYYGLGLAVRSLVLAPWALRDRAGLTAEWRRNRGRIVTVGALSPLAYLLVLSAMQLAPLAYVAPAREVSMMIGLGLGALWLRERVTPARIAGCMLMLGGVVLLAGQP
jgi:drug/metabolite transporter (DMT)-like permease